MSARRRGGARAAGAGGVGWLRWLVRTALLAAGGFALGVAVGVVMEDPALVLEHMTGRSVRVALDDGDARRSDLHREPAAPAAATGGLAAPAPAQRAGSAAARESRGGPQAAGGDVPSRPARPAPARPAPAGAPPVAAPPPAGYAVQVGAFETETAARALVERLRQAGFPAYVAAGVSTRGSRRFRVRVGPVGERDRAERLAARLSSEQSLPTWVTQEEGR